MRGPSSFVRGVELTISVVCLPQAILGHCTSYHDRFSYISAHSIQVFLTNTAYHSLDTRWSRVSESGPSREDALFFAWRVNPTAWTNAFLILSRAHCSHPIISFAPQRESRNGSGSAPAACRSHVGPEGLLRMRLWRSSGVVGQALSSHLRAATRDRANQMRDLDAPRKLHAQRLPICGPASRIVPVFSTNACYAKRVLRTTRGSSRARIHVLTILRLVEQIVVSTRFYALLLDKDRQPIIFMFSHPPISLFIVFTVDLQR